MTTPYKNIKIVYLVGGPLTARWLDYYHTDEMAEMFDVEFWDCSKVIENAYKVSAPLHRDYLVRIADLDDYQRRLQSLPKDVLAVIEIGLIAKYYSILKMASRHIKNGVIIDFWTYYVWDIVKTKKQNDNIPQETIARRIKEKLYQYDIIWLMAKICRCRRLEQVRDVLDTYKKRKQYKKDSKEDEKCRKLFRLFEITYKPHQQFTINHPDYEKYLLIKNQVSRKDRYVVFVADYYPFHPEVTLSASYSKAEVAKEYYSSLNRFFRKVECQMNCKVVIAEHPSAKWEDNPFDGREIIYYKTAELVRDSAGVCMHCSCAFSFVALFDKPVAILYNRALEASEDMIRDTRLMASSLQTTLCNTDTAKDVSGFFRLTDREVRQHYINTFADADCNEYNVSLLKKHFESIHRMILEKH